MAVNDPTSAEVIRALLLSLEEPGAVNPGFARHLTRQLSGLLRAAPVESAGRGSAFDGRITAIDGVPELQEHPHLPAV